MGGMGDTTTAGAAAGPATLGPAWRGLTDTSASSGGAGKQDAGVTGRRRYEFVVMLLWREPVPPVPGAEGGPAGGQ
jgi:hypothetical protein